MSIYAVIEGSDVVNVIEWDGVSAYNPGEGMKLICVDGLPVGPGFSFDGENFIPPANQEE